jgi:hypothetical protein
MSASGRGARLRRLEVAGHEPTVCLACGDRPSHVAYVDPATDETWKETGSATGCPRCGVSNLRSYTLVVPVPAEQKVTG